MAGMVMDRDTAQILALAWESPCDVDRFVLFLEATSRASACVDLAHHDECALIGWPGLGLLLAPSPVDGSSVAGRQAIERDG